MNLSSPITALRGIGAKSAEKFYKVGIETIGDLISYYPRDYERFEEPGSIEDAEDGKKIAVRGELVRQLSVRMLGRYQIVTGKIQTDTEIIPVTWFNQPYLRSHLLPGRVYVFRGLVKVKGNTRTLTQPQIFAPEEYETLRQKLRPVYPLTASLTENALRKAIAQALEAVDLQGDYLPEDMRLADELAAEDYAIRQIHFPEDEHAMLMARKRIVFDEFLLFILSVRQLKESREQITHHYTLSKAKETAKLIESLPYALTDAQKRVWAEVEQDMTKQQVMARLVQGDVGSGKTIIAFLALIMAAANGAQGALMVPTEVLARQHYEAYEKLRQAHDLPYEAVLLTGSMGAKDRREAYERITSGAAQIIIGTHALIQEKVEYHKLVLVITDEQHRFGVKQRETFSYKGELPHTLVMSATPIPRTLAVILYGDLDISVIDELPAMRLPIKNAVVDQSWRPKAYAFLEKEVRAGHQAYVICPMVEESEGMDAENVLDYTEKLKEALPGDIRITYLHGKMKAAEKNAVMEQFLAGEIDILVSTTVVEVGVNVPNATVMMVEDAQRFGLAQLHQLRGRVGRGDAQSYCIFVHRQAGASKRLDILKKSNDGFVIARKDLELRGPGDLFGIRQSGELAFKLADIFQDARILQLAKDTSDQILIEDAQLSHEKYRNLRKKLMMMQSENAKNLNI